VTVAVKLVTYESHLPNLLYGFASFLEKLGMIFTVLIRPLCFQCPRTGFFNCLTLSYIVV